MWRCLSSSLLFLESTDPKRDVQMFINSQGICDRRIGYL
ncbi:ATP-dependent Clp protease proteolytic subunit [Okeania hirsuta]